MTSRTTISQSRDVVIVGAGIIGLSIAWELARRSKLKVAVFDKGLSVGAGSTGASSAVCRYRYSLDEMLTLAKDGISKYQRWPEYVECTAPRASFHHEGVLWMPGEDVQWAATECARLTAFDIDAIVIDDDELQTRYPALNPCTIAPDVEYGEAHRCRGGGRHLLELNGGYMEPTAAAQDLVDACRANGVVVAFGTEVTDVQTQHERISGVELADGTRISTPVVVNAAGPWCLRLNKAVGLRLNWNLRPTRIQVLYRDRPQALVGHIPITVDMSGGIYFRTQNRGQQLLFSSVREEDEQETVSDPDAFDQHADDAFQVRKLHLLHHRLPKLPHRGKVLSYCGLYTTNVDDVHPILGPTGIEGFWVANGFSGHGFKLAPAIGGLMAQAITDDALPSDSTVPLSFFSVRRAPIALANKSVLA